MPFYEYQCDACGHQLEALQKVADAPLRACPACGEARLRKLISRAAFRLKGTGWYETDFKNSGDKAKAKAKADDKTNGKSGDQSDSKDSKDSKTKPASDTAKPSSSTPMNKSA